MRVLALGIRTMLAAKHTRDKYRQRIAVMSEKFANFAAINRI